MKCNDIRRGATLILLATLVMVSVGPAAAIQVTPGSEPAQVVPPFEEMLPGVYVYWEWWNESSETVGPVPVDIREQYNYQYIYYVEDMSGKPYWIIENSEFNSTDIWSFSNLLVTIIFDPDGTFVSWLSTQPKVDNPWTVFWTPNVGALSGDEVFVYSSFYYSKYNYSYSYKAEYAWANELGALVNPLSVILKPEYQWASSLNASVSYSSRWNYCAFGYDVSEMTMKGNQTQWMQHYFAGLSVFNDTNHNDIMDLVYERLIPSIPGNASILTPNESYPLMNESKSELLYSFIAENATVGQIRTPFVNSDNQIEWSAEVTNIDGELISPFTEAIGQPSRQANTAASVPKTVLTRVESLRMTYRFEVTDEAAVLKIDQYIGEFTNPADGKMLPEAQGLSLALSYWSSFSSLDLVPLAGTTTDAANLTASPDTEPIAAGGLLFTQDDKPLVKVEFGGTYVWGWDNSTNTVGTAVLPMYLFAYPLTASTPLTNAASGASTMLSGSYNYSTCYGNWSGYSVLHDPVFIAYPAVSPGDVSGRISGTLFLTVLVGGTAIVILSAVIIRISRVRRSS